MKDFIFPDLVEIEYKTETTFDSNTIIIYLRRIIIPYMKAKSLLHILLILDSAKCHLTSDVSAFAIKNNIHLLFIPPRLTNLLQLQTFVGLRLLKNNTEKNGINGF